ncbi:hypothetical protein GCM10027217_46400 [Pseudomaricurvus hydrocarbonicus]
MLSLLATTQVLAGEPTFDTQSHADAQSVRETLIQHFSNSPNAQKQRVAELLSRGQGRQVELAGTTEVFYEDFEDGSHRLRQTLITPAGERIQLLAAGSRSELRYGDQVIIQGLQLDSEDESYLAYEANGSTTTSTSTSAAVTQTTGDQQTLILMVNFSDDSSQPFTPQEAADVVHGSSSDFLYENSFGQTSLSGNAYGWYNIATSVDVCDSELLMELADQAALADGIDPNSYARVVYVHPRRDTCGWSGLASLGGTPSRVLLNGTLDIHNATHEIGHTLGLKHAHALECDAQAWSSDCLNREYGDSLDNMGARMAHYNGFHKEQLGWLNTLDIAIAEQSGTYQLEPYAIASGGQAKVLKVLRDTDPATGERSWFYIEYRQGNGFDGLIFDEFGYNQANLLNGIIVRLGSESSTNSSNLLDMTPNSDPVWDFFDAALEVGQSYTDPLSGVTISTLYADSQSVQISVEFAATQPDCTRAIPDVALIPTTESAAFAGDSLQYQLSVTNADSSDCASAQFDLQATVPTGWTQLLSSSILTLEPGATGSTNLTVTAASNALEGAYVIESSAIQSVSGASATDSASFTLTSPAEPDTNSAPVAVDDSASTVEKTPLNIAALNNDHDADGDPLTVVAVSQPNDGSVSLNSDGTLLYTPPRKFTGSTTFGYQISDGEQQSSAQVTVLVEAASSETGPGGKGSGGNKGGKK